MYKFYLFIVVILTPSHTHKKIIGKTNRTDISIHAVSSSRPSCNFKKYCLQSCRVCDIYTNYRYNLHIVQTPQRQLRCVRANNATNTKENEPMKKIVTFISCILLTSMAGATLLIYEDFEDMTLGSIVSNNTGSALGTGITNWGRSSVILFTTTVTNSSSFGTYSTGSKALYLNSGTNATRNLTMYTSTASISSGEMYLSYLFSGTSATDPSYIQWRTLELGLRSGPNSNAGIGIQTAVSGTYGSDNSNTLMNNGTFMIINKFTGLGTTNSSASIWAINATAFDSIAAGGITEAELNSVAFLQASRIDTNNVQFLPNQQYLFFWSGIGSGLIDEVKIGTTLTDVTVIPEPATIGLFGFAAAIILMIRQYIR